MKSSAGGTAIENYIIIVVVSDYFDCTETRLYEINALISPRRVRGKIPEMVCNENIRGRICNSLK